MTNDVMGPELMRNTTLKKAIDEFIEAKLRLKRSESRRRLVAEFA
jgi:hypothetical protein